MDHCEKDRFEEEHQASDQSLLPTGIPDRTEDTEQPSQGQEVDSADDWDTDVETEDATEKERKSLSRAERYLKACRQTGAVPVASFLRNSSEADLNLNYYGLGPLGAKALAIGLQNDDVVNNLELEHNGIGAEGTHYLMEMLRRNTSIQSLNLSNNQLRLEGADIIAKMLINNYYVKSIKLAGNYFDNSAAKYLADALKGDSVVKELDLSHNQIGDGGEHLGDMLASNVGIEVLNLSWNHLFMRGAVALSAGLKQNSTVNQLQLAWNGFGRIEAESLGQALKQNTTLVLLDLSCNNIDDQALTPLCQGLATNDTLRILKLSHNLLTNIGALTLLSTVNNNMSSALEVIDISGVRTPVCFSKLGTCRPPSATVFVDEDFLELLEEVRQRRPALDVQYSVMCFVTRNMSALQVFLKFLEERKESIMDFFQALDKEGTMKISTSAFRKSVKAANTPLDQHQLAWLIKQFDKRCTATINYSSSLNQILSAVNT